MTVAIPFDTHRFVKNLMRNGFSERQAEALAEEQITLLNENLATKVDIEALQQATKVDIEALQQATKKDIDALRQATKKDIEALRQATKKDIGALRQATKKDIEALRLATEKDIDALREATRADINEAKWSLVRWMFGAVFGLAGLIVALR